MLERSVYVPALNDASFNGGDDFLGSARERLFGFINGQTDAYSPLWDAQLGLWTLKAVAEGLNKRQIDENVVFTGMAARPEGHPGRAPGCR